MAQKLYEESNIQNIADAIRTKLCTTDTYKTSEMADAINSIVVGSTEDIPESAFILTGDCDYKYRGWGWFVEKYKGKISSVDMFSALDLFYGDSEITAIPFEFNFAKDTSYPYYNEIQGMFEGCRNVTSIGNFNNTYIGNTLSSVFSGCTMLKELPDFVNADWSYLQNKKNLTSSYMLDSCFSLRKIPDWVHDLFDTLTINTGYYYLCMLSGYGLYTLDEIVGHPTFKNATITSNMKIGNNCEDWHRLKDFTFRMNEDGTPRVVSWHSQTLSLNKVGYVDGYQSQKRILNYNSGITADKEVTDDASYQALKDDPDWFTLDIAYSRYNHDSAVRTINSLPDTSAYLATVGSGKTNTLALTADSGSKTDGGAVGTLTEEEIAVATAKGWTVTFV